MTEYMCPADPTVTHCYHAAKVNELIAERDAEIMRLRAALELDRPRAAWAKAVSEQQLLMEKLEFLRICLFGAQSKARAAQPAKEDRT